MKVLHIISALPTGGAERMLVKFISETKGVVKHSVLSLKDKGDQGVYIEKAGVHVYELNIQGSVPSIVSLRRMNRLVKELKPDIIQGWMYHGNLAAFFAGKKYRNAAVLFNVRHSLHDIKSEKLTTQLVVRLNSLFSKKVDGIIYNSQVSKVQHENFGYSAKSSLIIPNGFDTDTFKFSNENRVLIRKEFNIPKDSFLFVQIGRNHRMKNHVGFIKSAIKTLTLITNKTCYFLIVGQGVDEDSELRNLVKNSGFEKRILFSGERTDIEKIWSAADCGVLSSSWGEGFPNVVGEAMACETPCIVTDIGDSAYVVGTNGVVVSPNNSEEITLAMIKILKMSNENQSILSKKARERIVDNFSIEEISSQYLNLYNKFLNKNQ